MPSFQINLKKEGQKAPTFNLNLKKGETFTVQLNWDSKVDLDAHALLCRSNAGQDAICSNPGHILSTYNTKRWDKGNLLSLNSDGKSFSTLEGSLTHSGDVRDGTAQDEDETITINTSKIPEGINEIPIFATVHEDPNFTFSQVKGGSITIKKKDGTEIATFNLSRDFQSFSAIQMGSLLLTENGWEFSAVGAGFKGDFGSIFSQFFKES